MCAAHQLPTLKKTKTKKPPLLSLKKKFTNKNAKTDVSHLACNSIQVPGALGSQSATTAEKNDNRLNKVKY